MVGFWSFVSAVAFNGDERDAPFPRLIERALVASEPKSSGIVTGSIAPVAAKHDEGCVAVMRRATSRGVALTTCPAGAAQLRDGGRQNRSDRAADLGGRAANPGAWASTTETKTTDPVLPAFTGGEFETR